MPCQSFKSCPRVGGILGITKQQYGLYEFQVVPPCGGHRNCSTQGSNSGLVSSRAPVWGASCVFFDVPFIRLCFKSCPRVGGIPCMYSKHYEQNCFKSCPRVGGIFLQYVLVLCVSLFQVVPPCGGHQKPRERLVKDVKFQVVPPCGGHLKDYIIVFMLPIVSSRAPVWGASFIHHSNLSFNISFKSCPRVGGICNFAQKACC